MTRTPSITPRLLDIVANGYPVFIRRRKDGSIYATGHDFSNFLPDEPPLATVRVPITRDTPADFKPEEHASVLSKLAEFQ